MMKMRLCVPGLRAGTLSVAGEGHHHLARVLRATAGDAVQILAAIEEAAAGSRPSEDGVSLALEAFPERAATFRRFRSICSKASSEVMQG